MKSFVVLVAIITLIEVVRSQKVAPLRQCTLPGTKCIPKSQCSKGFQDAINVGSRDVVHVMMRATYCGIQYEPLHCCKTDCITPNGDYGLCKPLSECQYFSSTLVELEFLALSVRSCNNGQSQNLSSVDNDEDTRRNERALICCSDKQDIGTRKVDSPFAAAVRISHDNGDTNEDGNNNGNGNINFVDSNTNNDLGPTNIEPRFGDSPRNIKNKNLSKIKSNSL